jgi:hypothetical protein
MDIEGCEFEWIETLDIQNLKNIKQIVIEFHGIYDNSFGINFDQKLNCFRKITETHYLIHCHGNNWSKTLLRIPNVVELTFIRKSIIKRKNKFKSNNNSIKIYQRINRIKTTNY